jgi:serine/threonine-protein kinase
MIDGRGRARITDFGLARFVEDAEGAEILAGTPAYMAPEQLAGREVSVRSDIYSLGLVLYELFTGKRAFNSASGDERRGRPSETTPSSPSSLMEGFDPAVERVILRCLESDPARRPSSALAVAAALPGGDPLAAAPAAERPRPGMVAEAETDGGVAVLERARVFFVALGAHLALAPTSLLGLARLESRPRCSRTVRGRSSRRRATTGSRPIVFLPSRRIATTSRTCCGEQARAHFDGTSSGRPRRAESSSGIARVRHRWRR